MFIPLNLNLPLLVGGAVQWYVSTRSKDKEVNQARTEKGTLLASGLIAGGALLGVVSTGLKFIDIDMFNAAWQQNPWSEVLSLVAYLLLIGWLIRSSMKAKK
jgi:hypothetical protein